MNFWKFCLSFLLFSTTIGYASKTPVAAICSDAPIYEELYYPIINQQLISDSSLYPFLNCPYSTFCDYPGTKTGVQENLEDWQKFFGNILDEETLVQLVYRKDLEWYKKLYAGESEVVNSKLGRKVKPELQKPFAKYMILAKQCEGISSNNTGGRGWYQGEYDSANDEKPELFDQALNNNSAETNPFLRNRYGYQIVRLAHYLQENEMALEAFNSYLKLDAETPYIYYLALEQRSGAAYNMGHLQVATKGFLEVYSNVPSRRENCALSLRLLNWADPQLNNQFFAENGYAEIESFFKSYYSNGSVAREMENLQNTNPNSPYLEVLAMREVDKLQNKLFRNNYYRWNRLGKNPENLDSQILQTLQHIAKSQLEKEDVQRKDFWKIILAATYLKNDDYNNAEMYASQISEDSEMFLQAKRLRFSIEVLKLDSIDREGIQILYSQLKNDTQLYGSSAVSGFFFNHISELYKAEGNVIISLLGSVQYPSSSELSWREVRSALGNHSRFYYKNELVKDETIESLQGFIDQPNKTEYEKLILSKLKSNPQDYANELRGTWYFQQNKLDEAISYFEKINNPSAFYGKYIRSEMFSGAIREYFDTPFAKQSDGMHLKYDAVFADNILREEQKETYPDNKLKLAQTFQKLESLAKSDPKNAADYYYMLGNAWYNISERGWFLNSLHYVGNNNRNHILNRRYYSEDLEKGGDTELAQTATSYFQKVLKAQGNKETKAKATFMLAKTNYCFTTEKTSDYKHKVMVCGDHKDYFTSLKNNYSDTEFEKEVIKECSWYRSFLNM